MAGQFESGKIPVTRAFSVADRNANPFLLKALELIGKVHTDGELPRVIFQYLPYSAEGEYRPTIPPQILIDTDGRHKLSTVLHEIAHVLDQFGIGDGMYSQLESSRLRDPFYTGPLSAWWHGIVLTPTVEAIRSALDNPQRLKTTVDGFEVIPDLEDILYMLAPEELWARSYLQYITIKTHDDDLISELQSTLNKQTFIRLEQWPQQEFEIIEAQIDTLFNDLGWREQ
jgi:hypothetical protein